MRERWEMKKERMAESDRLRETVRESLFSKKFTIYLWSLFQQETRVIWSVELGKYVLFVIFFSREVKVQIRILLLEDDVIMRLGDGRYSPTGNLRDVVKMTRWLSKINLCMEVCLEGSERMIETEGEVSEMRKCRWRKNEDLKGLVWIMPIEFFFRINVHPFNKTFQLKGTRHSKKKEILGRILKLGLKSRM